MSTISKRISIAMSIRNIKQADLVKETGISKGAMSCYINGKYEPKQEKIHLLANALDVSEEWLMGYDVPMKKRSSNFVFSTELNKILLDVSEKLGLTLELTQEIYMNLRLEKSLTINYDNVYSEIKKFLLNSANKVENIGDAKNNYDENVLSNKYIHLKGIMSTFGYGLGANDIGYTISYDYGLITITETELDELLGKAITILKYSIDEIIKEKNRET